MENPGHDQHPSHTTPTVCVIVPTRNRAMVLRDCVRSLVAQKYATNSIEIIVVDDGSTDATRSTVVALSDEYPQTSIRYLRQTQLGPNAARNAAIRASKAELLVFVDDDIEAPPGWLEALVGGAIRNPTAGCIGGPIRLRFEGRPPRLCRTCSSGETELDLGPDEVVVTDGFSFGTGNMLVPAKAMRLVGIFAEDLPIYNEDAEWQHRMRRCGFSTVYVPQAWLWHRRTADELRLHRRLRRQFRFGYGQVAFRRAIGDPVTVREAVRRSLGIPGLIRHAMFDRCSRGLTSAAGQLGQLYGVLLGAARSRSA